MERVTDETDLLIIGGGPAGMSAAIRAKQIANELGKVKNTHIFSSLNLITKYGIVDVFHYRSLVLPLLKNPLRLAVIFYPVLLSILSP